MPSRRSQAQALRAALFVERAAGGLLAIYRPCRARSSACCVSCRRPVPFWSRSTTNNGSIPLRRAYSLSLCPGCVRSGSECLSRADRRREALCRPSWVGASVAAAWRACRSSRCRSARSRCCSRRGSAGASRPRCCGASIRGRGNPLWALAIALELEARSLRRRARGRSADPPHALRCDRASAQAPRSACQRGDAAIAALSQPTLAMLQAAIPEFALSDLESAEQAGVIEIAGDRVRFTHPLLASTHYANTPVSKRRELHRLLATVIDDEEERAQHVALGAEAPDRDLADSLEQAARVAARRGAHRVGRAAAGGCRTPDADRPEPTREAHESSPPPSTVSPAERRPERGTCSRR